MKTHGIKEIKTWIRGMFVTGAVAIIVTTTGCGKPEAVITPDGEDMTTEQVVYDQLAQSTAKKFDYDDLTLGAVKYYMTDAEIEAVYGKPDKVIDVTATEQDGSGNASTASKDVTADEKVYVYGGRILGFYNMDGAYRLVSVESSEKSDGFARGLSVGDTFDEILAVYYRDVDCMNNNYFSADSTAALGKYLYGSYTMDSLDAVKPTDDVAYGVINYNGYASYEQAESFIVEFTFFKAPYKSGVATTSDDFAQIAFDIDKDKKITSIRWYYYPELSE
ncbi:MAG: hypothetical protein IJB96_00225 [Lachnospira sp.]|nr:hypothetical protein [Lachnospira sp.]